MINADEEAEAIARGNLTRADALTADDLRHILARSLNGQGQYEEALAEVRRLAPVGRADSGRVDLDKLARRLLARRRGHTTIGTSADSPWLFPGALAGQPLSNHHLGTRLRRLGIYSRPCRTSALIELSTQLPAAVLTDLLGISPETATAWTQSGGNWAPYAAELPGRTHPRG
ncbi:hypothetical protein [Streptomyces mirabilis]|uniref:hypothetical protein n=1 Tax=Streptomyces mirabilis TaxID=68239 RepID=UPI0033EC565D